MKFRSIRRSMARKFGHQAKISRGKERIVNFLAPKSDDFDFNVEFFGYSYPGNTGNYIDWKVYYFGCYEKAALRFMSKVLSDLRRERGRLCSIDIGANVGHHSLFLARMSDIVYAFEPWKYVFDRLKEKMTINNISHVKAFNFGLGATDAMLAFREPDPRHGNLGWGHFVREEDPARVEPKLEVRHGDTFFSIGVPEVVSLIKLDVEGFEKDVLSGLRRRIFSDRPIIIMEFSNPADFDSRDEFHDLIYPDHRIFELLPRDIEFSIRNWTFGPSDTLIIVPVELLGIFPPGLFPAL